MPGHECLSQDCPPPPNEGGEETKTVYRINVEAMKTLREVGEGERERESEKCRRPLQRVPGFWL